ncbi:MAG: sigma-70 family RNA polymerase sigma factor [Deinococcus sp.]|nr:sigma-70 family RNA polymerase sigma factor [Deinococcus sp.]
MASTRRRKTSRAGIHSGRLPADAPDELLLQSLASGQEEAFGLIYDRYERLVRAFALRMLRDRGKAEEVVQDVFHSVWRRARTYRPSRGRFTSWLLAITHNRATDLLRRKVLPAADPEELGRGEESWGRLEALDPDPASSAEASWLAERLRTAISRLSADHRQVIELAYYGGRTQREIASAVGCPLGTVKSRMKYGLDNLRRIMAEMGLGEMAG